MPEYVWCRCAPATYFGSSIYIYILIQSYTLKLWCYFLILLGRLTLSFLWSRRGRNWGCKNVLARFLKIIASLELQLQRRCCIGGEENSNTVQTNLESSRIWTMFVAGVDLFFLWPKVYDFFKNQPGYPGDPWKPWFSLENDLNVGVTLVHQVIALWLR